MSDKHALIQKRLRDEGDKLLAVFEGLTPEQWQLTIYTDGMTWTITARERPARRLRHRGAVVGPDGP